MHLFNFLKLIHFQTHIKINYTHLKSINTIEKWNNNLLNKKVNKNAQNVRVNMRSTNTLVPSSSINIYYYFNSFCGYPKIYSIFCTTNFLAGSPKSLFR